MGPDDPQDYAAYIHVSFFNAVDASTNFCCRPAFLNQTIGALVAAGGLAELGTPWMNDLRISQSISATTTTISVNFPAGFFATNGLFVSPTEQLQFQIRLCGNSTDAYIAADVIGVYFSPTCYLRDNGGGSLCRVNGAAAAYTPGAYTAQCPNATEVFNLAVLNVMFTSDAGSTVSVEMPSILFLGGVGNTTRLVRELSVVRLMQDYP